MTKDIQGVPEGHVVVTWDQDRTRILAVTRQDDDGHILKVLAQAPAVGAEWDGKLHPTLQRALNALRLEVAPEVANGVEHEVRESFRALWTDKETLRRMYRAAQDRCDAFDAAQPDPFEPPVQHPKEHE